MILTPDIARAAYDFLRTGPPFRRLPPGEEVEFRVTRDRTTRGCYTNYVWTKDHIIEISEASVEHLATLFMVMAHEMIHALQHQRGTAGGRGKKGHNAEFHRLAKRVCRQYGFDYRTFV